MHLLLPTPRFGHKAVCVFARYLLCIGGKAAGSRLLPQCSDGVVGGSTDILDTVTGRWVSLPCRLASPRVNFGAAAVGSMVIVCGGMSLGSSLPPGWSGVGLSSTEVLDVTKLPELFMDGPVPELQWCSGPSLQFEHTDFSLAGPIDGCLFAVGGGGGLRRVEMLDVRSIPSLERQVSVQDDPSGHDNTPTTHWELCPVDLPEVRNCASVVAVDRRLILLGGTKRNLFSYEPGAAAWEPLGVGLDTTRLGASVTSFGCRAS